MSFKNIFIKFNVLFILLPYSVYAQQNDLSLKDKDAKSPNTVTEQETVLNDATETEIYQISINNNWTFSGLTSFDKENIFIPLKFLPSDMLGNLTETNMVDGQDRSLKISKKLAPTIDPDSLILKINLSEDFFKNQLVLNKEEKKNYAVPIDALFVNYDLNIPVQKIANTRGFFNFNWASKHNWIGKNELAWNGEKLIRLNTNWKKQFEDNSLLIIGDTSGNTPAKVNSLNFLGARYASAYFNSGTYINSILPTVPISGFAVNPTKLDIYLNNQLFQSSELNSGKYNINIPLQRQGYGVAEAYVYDVTGKPIIVSVPFYGNNEIIKEGEHAYDVSAGTIRKNYAIDSLNYESFVANALYKRGITETYTQDLFLQYSPLYSIFASISHWIPSPDIGKLTFGYNYNSLNQQLFKLGYERSTQSLSFGGSIEVSPLFCFGFNQSCIKRQIQLFSSIPLPKEFGSFSATAASKTTETGTNTSFSTQWNKQINKEVTIFANLTHSKNTSSNNIPSSGSNGGISLYVGLSWNLGGGKYSSSSLSKSSSGLGVQQAISISENPDKPYLGSGSLTYSKNGDTQSLNGFYSAKLDKLNYQISAFQDKKSSNINATINGSIAYIPEANFISFNRQIQNGLTFVQVENTNLPTPILHGNKLSGYSDTNGKFLVTESVALNQETVMIDINKLPPDVTIEEYKKEYYLPFSGAVKIDFKSKPLPYIVNIKGVKAGAIFNIEKDYYVVGEDGITAIDSSGKATIPLENGVTCELEFTNKQKDYDCIKGK